MRSDKSRIHIPEEESEEGEEIWLISYSDMMTLLFGFFVLMYAFASSKQGDAEKVKEGIAKSFGGAYIPPYDKLADQLKQQGDKNPILKSIDVEKPKDGLEITFRSALLFKSGSAELMPKVKQTMKILARVISRNVDNAEIFVGGHTDDAPIHTRRYPSNWELSSARAAAVVREFISQGYDAKMLVAMGYAETRPEYPNRDQHGKPIKVNRVKNRRVVIKVVAPGVVKQATGSSAGFKRKNDPKLGP